MKNIYNNMIKVLPTGYCKTCYEKFYSNLLRYRLFAKCNDDILTRFAISIVTVKRLEEATPLVQTKFGLSGSSMCGKHDRFLLRLQFHLQKSMLHDDV
jgi:hypothetical protein